MSVNQTSASLLVVDDNENNRYTLKHRLQRLGYGNIDSADNGRQALQMLVDQPYDLVLLDIMMPEMNGYEVLEKIHADPKLRSTPVIMISAVDELESIVRCIELGADDYLFKPFNPVLLRARVGASLEKKRMRDEIEDQLDFIREAFGQYVPRPIARRIVATQGALKPVKGIATMLYSDIEGFSRVSENMPPETLMQVMNEYFTVVLKPLTRWDGVVNHFQGDGMLVTFNVPLESVEHADNAVRAAIEIQEILKERTFSGVKLPTRIGINTGMLIAGSVGSEDRINYAVCGAAVNVAARLEELNKQFGSRVIISKSTLDLLTESYSMEPLGEIPIRGMDASQLLFKLM